MASERTKPTTHKVFAFPRCRFFQPGPSTLPNQTSSANATRSQELFFAGFIDTKQPEQVGDRQPKNVEGGCWPGRLRLHEKKEALPFEDQALTSL